jgi:REP-associated tyrosine transposase
LTVLRYIERNPLRVNLIVRAEHWPWSSLTTCLSTEALITIHPGPVPRHQDWIDRVNAPMTDAELNALRRSVNRERTFGSDSWTARTARQLGLESSLRPRGRPAQRTANPEVNP